MISPNFLISPARPVLIASALIAAIGASAIIGAYIFQYGLGLAPCPLCLQQRTPYYIAIPVAVALLAAGKAPRLANFGTVTSVPLAGFLDAILPYRSCAPWKTATTSTTSSSMLI